MVRRVSFSAGMAAAAALWCASADAKTFDVVKDGSPQCVIVLSPMASPSDRLAAEELSAYVKKMSGAELQVRTELPGNRADHQPSVRHESAFSWVLDPDKPNVSIWEKVPGSSAPAAAARKGIVIGTLANLTPIPKAVRKRLEECPDEEAFFIKSDGDNIFIIGKTPIGALYGTYTLLETHLGVRWFYPGDLGEHVPKKATVTLPDIDDFQKPDRATRYPRGGSGPYHAYDTVIWGARHKMQTHGVPALRWFEPGLCTPERADFLNAALNTEFNRGGHDIFGLTVPNALFKEHPEYFPLKAGERKSGGRLQRCVSNPDVFKRVAEFGLAWCNENPRNIFSICAEDSMGTWCECEACRKMGTVDRGFKVTNLYHRFFSRVVDYILERNPNARIDVMFYIDKGVAPDDKDIRYRGKNVRGVYCTCYPHARCYAHAFMDPACELNKKCLEDLRDVLKICPRIYTFEYLCNSNIEYPPVWKTTARDIKDLAALGVEGYMDITHGYTWRARWPSLYLGAKLHWDTRLDPEKVMDEAYDVYYGAAAPVMKTYHALRLKLWENAPGHAFYGGPKRMAYCLTVPGAEKELRDLLADAKKRVAGGTIERERVALDETFLDMFWKTSAEELKKRFSAESQLIPERAREKITVDGVLSEAVWLAARPVGGFLSVKTRQPAAQESSLRLAYDEGSLYIGFVAMNDKAWGSETANMKARDGKEIWGDDHIELELAPPDNGGRFYHIGVNTRGVLYDALMNGPNADPRYDSQAEVKVTKLPDRFVYEIRLPLAPMAGSVSPGKVWGLYVLRAAHNLQPPEDKECSSLDGNYPHRVMEFRQVVFGANAVPNGNFSDRDEKKKSPGEMTGGPALRHWSVNAEESAVLDAEPKPVRLRLKKGLAYAFLQLPARGTPGALAGEIHAAGQGTLRLSTSTCLRPPGGPAKPFSHSIKKEAGPFQLSQEPAVFKFTIPLEPYETGYLYIHVAGEAVISHVSGVAVEPCPFEKKTQPVSSQTPTDFRFGPDGIFTLMQVTDIQDDDTPKPRVAAFLDETIKRYKPDLIVITGDNTYGCSRKGAFEKSVSAFTDVFKTNKTCFAVTFGNHDSEKKGEEYYTRDEQYALYKELGGGIFVDHDVPGLSGTGSGVIPLRSAADGRVCFNIFLMDSGAAVKGGYDGVRGDQIKWYEETGGKVPCLWFQHIIVPDIYDTGLFIPVPTNTPKCVFYKKGEFAGRGYLLDQGRATGFLTEPPGPTTRAAYTNDQHTYEGRTLYASWRKMGNLKGAYFGHDHSNTFDGTDTNGIRLGYTRAATLQAYNDNNPGLRVFLIKEDGTYTTRIIKESDLKKR